MRIIAATNKDLGHEVHSGRFREGLYHRLNVIKLYFDPETCIDCGACVPVCPVQAIFPQEEVPEKWANYTQIDADWYAKRK